MASDIPPNDFTAEKKASIVRNELRTVNDLTLFGEIFSTLITLTPGRYREVL